MRSHRFTAIELMIVVAIIMVLAAIAIPVSQVAVARARAAEGRTNADSIVDGLIAYIAATDGIVQDSGSWPIDCFGPPGLPGLTKQTHPWGTPPAGSWANTISWAPDGDVRCSYMGAVLNNLAESIALCDVDDDNISVMIADDVHMESGAASPGVDYNTESCCSDGWACNQPGPCL